MEYETSIPRRYPGAIEQATAFINQRFAPVAIIASGTIVQGTFHASSDLDIVVIHNEPWRQRVQRFFNQLACEMFVNPPFQVRRQLDSDARSGRPVMAHMLATGTILHDTDRIGHSLQQEARASLADGPRVDPEWIRIRRYGIATLFEDARDIKHSDAERSRSLAMQAVVESVEWWFLSHGHWLPRSKALLADFANHQPELAAIARSALGMPAGADAIRCSAPMIQQIIGATGFFEWEGLPQPLDP